MDALRHSQGKVLVTTLSSIGTECRDTKDPLISGSLHTPWQPPERSWTPKGMPWKVLPGLPVLPGLLPVPGQLTKGHRLCGRSAFVAQRKAQTTGVQVN